MKLKYVLSFPFRFYFFNFFVVLVELIMKSCKTFLCTYLHIIYVSCVPFYYVDKMKTRRMFTTALLNKIEY